jgi:hypothetical protein
MDSVRFESKVDMWLVAIIVASLGMPIGLTVSRIIYSGFDHEAVILLFAVLPAVLPLVFLFKTTYYVVTDESIIAHCLFSRTMPLASVKSLRPTRNPLSAPALSLDRIEIVSNSGDRFLVSPKDKQAFVSAVVRRAPQTSVEDFSNR